MSEPLYLSNDALMHAVREVFQVESDALRRLADTADQRYIEAIRLVKHCQGRIVVCGMGKSGLIGKKIAASFASLGKPAFFMHPGEAFHGDLGMVQPGDVLLLLSYSGETDEVLKIIPSLKHFGNKIIAITGGLESSLAKNADLVLDASIEKEACPNNLAPTTSTTVALAIGDALAATLALETQFSPMDFAKYHPGGSLGRRLLTRVKDVMRSEQLPTVGADTPITDALMVMTQTRTGLALVMQDDALLGVITDGDVRRYLLAGHQVTSGVAQDMMTRSPRTVDETCMLAEAEELMREKHIKWLVVTNAQQRVSGILEWSQ
ncbi:KpsF/GutQ family sugar-phosphate isomerase [Motilimonas cestriensis]|uniref:Arabinose 5-phosphate isomerase n=1 Tax=Motilimonas cestriensis TaxID=2742685 RepID=A0ABS8WAI0_9GAMM|nr:KpsF/GutQ family sugar-phosphate isomerase [Motilimonas cestriensis]MCE2596017.1 KpsF/GutQ family sugar-phosphate isomerase [Motilimonas cestriensis]